MPFLELAYQADVSRYDDPEFEEYARRNCNEHQETRAEKIEELRRMILPERRDERERCKLLRHASSWMATPISGYQESSPTDDTYLVIKVVRYEEFRLKNAYLYEGIDCFALKSVKHVYGGTLPENPVNGRITLMRFGKWDTDAVPIDDVVRGALFMDEIAVLQPRLQVLGVTIIVDLDGLNYRHVSRINPTVASHFVALMGISFPLHTRGIHIINYSWILHTFFYIFKRFIPSGAWGHIHFHGYDMSSLHKHIDPEYLPPEYGGHCRDIIKFEDWIGKIKRYKDEFLVHELKDLGFVIRED